MKNKILIIMALMIGFSFAQKVTSRTPASTDYIRVLDSDSHGWDQTVDQIFGSGQNLTVGTITGANAETIVNSTNGSWSLDGSIINSANVGTVASVFANSGTASVVEYGDGYNHVTVVTLTGVELGTPDPGNALAFGDTIYTFPEGIQVVEWFVQNVALTTAGVTTDTPELGIGSIKGAGAAATLGAAGATMEDYSVGAAVDSCGGTSEAIGPIGATAGIFTGIALNDTSKVKSVCLNVADTWDASVTDSLIVSGTVSFKWTTLE